MHAPSDLLQINEKSFRHKLCIKRYFVQSLNYINKLNFQLPKCFGKKGAFNNFANRKCCLTFLHLSMFLQKLMTMHILNIYSWFYVAISFCETDIGVWPFSKNILTYYTPKYHVMDTGNDLIFITYFVMMDDHIAFSDCISNFYFTTN